MSGTEYRDFESFPMSSADAPSTAAASPEQTTYRAVAPLEGFSQGSPEQNEKCRGLVAQACKRDVKAKALHRALKALGVDTPIECAQCPADADGNTPTAGGYVPDRKSVVLCQQWVAAQPSEVPNTLAHELVHAYDDARAHVNWLDLTHHACTEIRAANLSGDCSFGREFDRGRVGPLSVAAAGERCVRRRAELSVAMNPACPNADAAAGAVERAWKTCYADTAPWECGRAVP